MSADAIAVVAWSFWGVLLAALLAGMVMVSFERQRAPEVSRGLGPLVVGVLLLLHLGAGGLLYWLAYEQSGTGLAVVTAFLALPALMIGARPAVMAFKRWSFERDEARVGDFRDPVLQSMADAVRAGDGARLEQLLAARPLPDGRDRAGNDLLAFALAETRDRQGSVACVRALLEAGLDPLISRTSDGQDPLHFMIVDHTPKGREVVLLLLKHGADANAVDPTNGDTLILSSGYDPDLVRALVETGADFDRIQSDGANALVHFVCNRRWDSAIYLIERGARLDLSNDAGLSLAYLEKGFERSADEKVSEGWARVKQAIAGRQGTAASESAGTPGR